MFKKLKECDCDIYLMPGDTIELLDNDEVILKDKITCKMHVDTAIVFECKDELGIKEGIGGIFGKK